MSDAPVEQANKRANKSAQETNPVMNHGSGEAMGGTTDPAKQGAVKWSSNDSFLNSHQQL